MTNLLIDFKDIGNGLVDLSVTPSEEMDRAEIIARLEWVVEMLRKQKHLAVVK